MNKLNWCILGAGSMGCLWAAKLSEKGISPTLILRPERFHGLGKNQVTLKLTAFSGIVTEHHLSITSAKAINTPIDRLIVCTKAQDAKKAVLPLKDQLTPASSLLLLQNGMGSQQEIVDLLPEQNIWAGSSTDGAFLTEPFKVCHAGKGETTIGEIQWGHQTAQFPFSDLLDNFGLAVHKTSDIKQILWRKLAVNCCINGLTALYDCKNGALVDHQEKYKHLTNLISETSRTLKGLNKNLNTDISRLVESVCRKTANNISSTCQDARSDRMTELAYINGFLLNLARQHGIAMPEYSKLLSALKLKGIAL
ncbi:2-dehydropantoate 2-reductase [Endozoicomonas sp. Mp262]|uniref:ketopantoate reductase family protein n=1 Tax=Endozoicomonas sp. Mp262 TaxID=2919499 RepID=UPI0021D88DE8